MKPFFLIACIGMTMSALSRGDAFDAPVDRPAAFVVTPGSLRCEYRADPLGIDVARPRLSWTLTATDAAARGLAVSAYRIAVASSPQALAAGRADLWDSGKTVSDDTQHVEYAGVPLASGQTAWWSVRTWDAADGVCDWSAPARWTAGVLSGDAWRGARWLAAPDALRPDDGKAAKAKYETLLLRRAFDVPKAVKRAVVHVCGLGQYRLTLNGRRVGDAALAPGWTDYKKTCLYDTYDVTDALRRGPNVAGLFVGNGFFNVHGGRYTKVRGTFGPVQAIALLRIEYADGSADAVVTDPQWKAASGPITFSSIYGGEDYDARLVQSGWDAPGFDDAAWDAPTVTQGPGGMLKGLSCAAPPVRVVQTLTPVASRQPDAADPGVTVYDLGQNAATMLALTVNGPAGSSVNVTASELVAPDGDIDDRMCGGQSYWTYTLRGGGDETYDSHFYYQGGRYLRVQLLPAGPGGALPTVSSIEGRVIRADAPVAGRIVTSNPRLDRIHALVRWAQMSNMMSVMTDCPHREKLGWLEETHLNGPALRYNFDLPTLMSKVTNDMSDAQRGNGLVPSLVPFYPNWPEGKFVWPIEWGSACILVPWQQYQFHGDTRMLAERYDGMKRYLHYLAGQAKGHVIDFGLGDWYDNLGEGDPTLTPVALTSTAFYFQDHQVMAQIAATLGKPDEAAGFERTAEEVRRVINEKFFNPATDNYASGAQGSNCLPLAMDIVEPAHRAAVLANLIADLRKHGTTTGEVSFRYLLRALADTGRSDVVYETYDTDTNGYGLQIKLGKTTLTEAWNGGTSSQNHFMFGQINEWLFHDLAGIQPDPAGPGFRKIIIRPAVVGDLTRVKATYDSPRGPVVSEWTRGPADVTLAVAVPIGSTATVYVPAADPESVKEGDTAAAATRDVTFLKHEGGCAVFAVGSGRYAFSSASGR